MNVYSTAHCPEGLTAVAEALAVAHKTQARWCEAELDRLKGELTLQKASPGQVSHKSNQVGKSKGSDPRPLPPDPQTEAETYFLQAIEIARSQEAKSLELRAVMSLSRLWQQQGKKKESRQILVQVYGWFTEGFATKDLQEAKALLEELGR